MKKFPKNLNEGMSTLEILLAFAILILAITAVIGIGFGNQSITVDAETNTEALYKAEKQLEDARAMSRTNFFSVVSGNSTSSIYSQSLTIDDLTPCKKQATSTISWNISGRTQTISLGTFLTDVQSVFNLGGDCLVNPPKDNWRNPGNYNSKDLIPAGAPATGIDVLDKVVFVTATPSNITDDDLFIFNAKNASLSNPPNLVWKINTGDGLNGIDLIKKNDFYYAFLVSNDISTPLKQLIIVKEKIDLSSAPEIIASSTLPGVSGSCTGQNKDDCPQGTSVYYFSPYLYVGTHRTIGNEFHIFCIESTCDGSASYVNPVWKGSLELDTNINSISVINQNISGNLKTIAYLGTSHNTKDLYIINSTQPSTPEIFQTLDISGDKDIRIIFNVGRYLYIGKDRDPSGPDLFIVDIFDPNNLKQTSATDIPMKANGNQLISIRGLRVAGKFAFLGTTDSTDPFQVWDITNKTKSAVRWGAVFNFSQKTTALDYEDDRVYTANESNDALRIIYSQ